MNPVVLEGVRCDFITTSLDLFWLRQSNARDLDKDKDNSSFAVTCRFTVSLLQCAGVTRGSKSNRAVVVSQFCISTFHFTAFQQSEVSLTQGTPKGNQKTYFSVA